jgi:hypothetical protein
VKKAELIIYDLDIVEKAVYGFLTVVYDVRFTAIVYHFITAIEKPGFHWGNRPQSSVKERKP